MNAMPKHTIRSPLPARFNLKCEKCGGRCEGESVFESNRMPRVESTCVICGHEAILEAVVLPVPTVKE